MPDGQHISSPKKRLAKPRPAVIEHVARAVAASRMPGLHFPGFFLGLHTHRLDQQGVRPGIGHGDQVQDQIRVAQDTLHPVHAQPLHQVAPLPDPRRIEEVQG